LASQNTTVKIGVLKTDSIQLLTEFGVRALETEAADPFYQWLHDADAVRIDWRTFGIQKFQPGLPD
jgi:hypothetical protein